MKVEYLPTGAEDCPLIRLFDFSNEDVTQFLASIDLLAKGRVVDMRLDEVPYLEPVSGCLLWLRIGKKDKGVLKTGDNGFDWILTDEGWMGVVELARPFLEADHTNCFQWLDDRGEVRVLLSQDGGW
jgi:hypothetical protein